MNSGYLPVWRSVLGMKSYREFLAGDPALSACERQMDVGLGRSPIDRHRLEINRFLAEAVENATLGKQDPKRALDEAATKANALLRDDHGAGEH